MPSDFFDFQRFRVYHDRCAMKVGTDGVLLGAWAEKPVGEHILDIGGGCGLVSLMMAQRYESANVVAVEIDPQAAEQAAENFARSPFSSRLTSVCADIRDFEPAAGVLYDCVVSNPPFFTEMLLPPSERRSVARNSSALPFDVLISQARRLMRSEAYFHVILPHAEADRFISLCAVQGLSLLERTDVCTKEGKNPKRTLLRLVNHVRPTQPLRSRFLLCDVDGKRSQQYQDWTRDFYL